MSLNLQWSIYIKVFCCTELSKIAYYNKIIVDASFEHAKELKVASYISLGTLVNQLVVHRNIHAGHPGGHDRRNPTPSLHL